MATITGRSREAEANSQRLLVMRISQRYERVIAREISRAMNQYANTMGEPMFEVLVEQSHQANLTSILTRLWNESGHAFSERLFDVAKSLGHIETKQFEVDITTPMIDQAVADWIRAYGGLKITQISNTTMNDINDIVAQGIEEGLSEREVGRMIAAVAPTKSASRSQTVARTETHGSGQGISVDVAKMTNITMQKIWIANLDERVRGADDEFNHAIMNGVAVGMSDTFKVPRNDGTVEELEYPGDPNGSAGNVIQCRCVAGFEIAE